MRSWGRKGIPTPKSLTRVWSRLLILWIHSCMLAVFLSWLITVQPRLDWVRGNGLHDLITFLPSKPWWRRTMEALLTRTYSATFFRTQCMEPLKSAPNWDPQLTFLCQQMQTSFVQSCATPIRPIYGFHLESFSDVLRTAVSC